MDSTCVTSPTRAVCKLQISGTGRCHVSSPASATSCHRGCCLGLYEFNRDTCREAVFFTELYNIRNMNTHTHTRLYTNSILYKPSFSFVSTLFHSSLNLSNFYELIAHASIFQNTRQSDFICAALCIQTKSNKTLSTFFTVRKHQITKRNQLNKKKINNNNQMTKTR